MIEYLGILPLSYFLIFIGYSLIKSMSKIARKIIFCTVCVTWATLLILGFILKFPPIILAFMLGMSITGIYYKFDEYLVKRKIDFPLQQFLIQLIFTILGLMIVVFYLKI